MKALLHDFVVKLCVAGQATKGDEDTSEFECLITLPLVELLKQPVALTKVIKELVTAVRKDAREKPNRLSSAIDHFIPTQVTMVQESPVTMVSIERDRRVVFESPKRGIVISASSR